MEKEIILKIDEYLGLNFKEPNRFKPKIFKSKAEFLTFDFHQDGFSFIGVDEEYIKKYPDWETEYTTYYKNETGDFITAVRYWNGEEVKKPSIYCDMGHSLCKWCRQHNSIEKFYTIYPKNHNEENYERYEEIAYAILKEEKTALGRCKRFLEIEYCPVLALQVKKLEEENLVG